MRGALRALLGRIADERRQQLHLAAVSLAIRRCSSAAAQVVDESTEEADSQANLDVIYAMLREDTGRLAAKKIRKTKRIPSIVFSQEDGHLGGHKELLTLEEKQVTNMVKRVGQSFFMSRLYMLEIRTDPDPKEGELIRRERVLPRLLDVHPVSDRILSLTLIRAPKHARLKVDIPLVFVGQDMCVGIKKGGYLNTLRRTVKYLCPPDLIPKFIEVDLTNLKVDDPFRIRDLVVPEGIVVYDMDPAWPVCKIRGSRSSRAPPGGGAADK